MFNPSGSQGNPLALHFPLPTPKGGPKLTRFCALRAALEHSTWYFASANLRISSHRQWPEQRGSTGNHLTICDVLSTLGAP